MDGISLNGKRILIVFDDFFGGAGNMAQLLGMYLSEKKDMEVVLVPTNQHSEPRYDLSGIVIRPCRFNISKRKPSSLFTGCIGPFRHLVKDVEPDLVLSFLDRINCIVCASLIDMPNIALVVSERNDPWKSDKSLLLHFIRGLFYRRAEAISVQFNAFRSFFTGDLFNKTFVTPNIVRKSALKASTCVNGPYRLISIGRLAPQKRFDLMIEVGGLLKERGFNFELSIYGEGPLKKQLNEQIAAADLDDCIVLKGKTKEVDKALSEGHLFLLTSEFEGFPNVVGEALATGLPVVAYQCHEGMTELIGRAGAVIPFGAIGDMADSIECLLTSSVGYDEAKRMALKQSALFAPDRVLADWENCLLRALESQGG